MTDFRVAALNSSIETRLRKFENDHLRGNPDTVQRRMMQEHQPEGGQWGAPCLGEHERPTPWPCDTMQGFDNPMAYSN